MVRRSANTREVTRLNPVETIIFALDILANPVLPCGGLGLVHLMPSWHPSQPQSHCPYCHVTIRTPSQQYASSDRTAMCHLVIGPYYTDAMCHPLSSSMCRLLVGPYTCHVILSVPYGCHVSPCQWCHVIMFV